MPRTAVKSRAIVSVGYDTNTHLLEVEFHGGRVYRYHDVPRDVHQFLMRTPEKGRYINTMITSSYRYEDVSAPAAAPEQDIAKALEASLRRSRKDD